MHEDSNESCHGCDFKKQDNEGNGTHGSAGGLFSGIFAPYFEIKSVNNLLFNKFKCKTVWQASYQERAVQQLQ